MRGTGELVAPDAVFGVDLLPLPQASAIPPRDDIPYARDETDDDIRPCRLPVSRPTRRWKPPVSALGGHLKRSEVLVGMLGTGGLFPE
jgi:hypothetical protein